MLAFCCRRGGDRAFLDFGYRLAGTTVQHKDMASLGGLNQHWRFHALGILDVIQHGLGRQVVIPHVVVNHLVNPFGFTGRCIDCHDGRAEFLLGLVTITAPIVRRAIAGRQVDQVQFFIVGRNSPYVRCFQSELVIGSRCICTLGCSYVPGPYQGPGQDIECPNRPGRLARHNVAYPAADHCEVAHDNRQRRRVIALTVFRRAHAFLEVDITLVPKALAKGAGVCIQCKQAGIYRRHQNTLATLLLIAIGGFCRRAQAVVFINVVVAHAAASDMLFALGMRVEFPDRVTRISVKSGDQVFRRT